MKNILKKIGNLSSISTIISLSLVLFVVGILSLTLINTKQISNTIKEEGIVFSMMLHDEPVCHENTPKQFQLYINFLKKGANAPDTLDSDNLGVMKDLFKSSTVLDNYNQDEVRYLGNAIDRYEHGEREKSLEFMKIFRGSCSKILKEKVEKQREQFKNYLEGLDYFLDIKFIDKEIAYKELQEDMGEDFSSILEVNPLPDSYDASIKAEFVSSDGLKKIENLIEKYKGAHVVQNIFYQEKIVEKIDSKTSEVSLFLLPFCVVFLLISFALINNTIRLSIYSKRLLIRTMRLVGATNLFIQKPYLISSIYQGFFSSVIAIFMLIGSVEMLNEIFPELILSNDFLEIAVIFGLILIFGIIISWISTFFAVRRYLNLNENELFN